MSDKLPIDPEVLIDEIARYLAAVDTFRAANCEPVWRRELPTEAAPPASAVVSRVQPTDIRLH